MCGIPHDLYGHVGRKHRGERNHGAVILRRQQPDIAAIEHRGARGLVLRPAFIEDRHDGAVEEGLSDPARGRRGAGVQNGAAGKCDDVACNRSLI